MEYQIEHSAINDLEVILQLYAHAREYQKIKGAVPWPVISSEVIISEINEKRQWKMILNGHVCCVWVTTFTDPHIWREKNNDPSLYIHRIAIDPLFRGKNLVGKVIHWSKKYARDNQKNYIRLDTVGYNKPLIDHYTKNGFSYLGGIHLKANSNLPSHYHDAEVSLFEMNLNTGNH